MKKLVVLLVIVLLLTACGSEKNNIPINVIADVDVDNEQTEITTTQGTEMVISNDLNESVDIPDDYPKNVLPVYKDSYIIAASKNADGSFYIMSYTNDEFEDIIKFYKEELKSATVLMEQSSASDGYINMGDLDGYTYTVSITMDIEETKYENVVSLIVAPSQDVIVEEETSTDNEESSSNEGSSEVTGLVVPEGINWPDDYPEDYVPAYNKGAAEVAIVMKQSNQTIVGLKTESKIDEVLEFYVEYLSEADDFSQMSVQGGNLLIGTLNGKTINVMLNENSLGTGEDMRYNTLIQVIY